MQNSNQSNIKVLQFCTPISSKCIESEQKPENAIKTGIFFEQSSKENIKIKTHITAPAMEEIRNLLIEKYGAKKGKEILSGVFNVLLSLSGKGLAPFVVYIPKRYFKGEVLDYLN